MVFTDLARSLRCHVMSVDQARRSSGGPIISAVAHIELGAFGVARPPRRRLRSRVLDTAGAAPEPAGPPLRGRTGRGLHRLGRHGIAAGRAVDEVDVVALHRGGDEAGHQRRLLAVQAVAYNAVRSGLPQ